MSFPAALTSPKSRKFSGNQSFLPSDTQANALVSVSQVKPEEGGVWEWTAGTSSLSESPASKWTTQVIMACFGWWNLLVTAPSAETVESQNRMGQIWAAPPHTLVTFSKLPGLLVHLQEINGLLWTSLARVCWNWESETVRLLMEVFGRIQDTCKKSHSSLQSPNPHLSGYGPPVL